MTPQELQSALEAIIYAADEPVTVVQLAAAVDREKTEVRAALDWLVASSAVEERGVEIRNVAGGFKMYTKPQHHDVVRKFIKSLRPPVRLTMPALETLAVIAYKQPATLPEIQEIRGVNCSGVIKTLLEKRLVTTAGRKDVVGRPILYRTSKEFLMRFGLSGVDELPSLKEFEQLAQAALGADEGIAPIEPEESTDVASFAEAETPGEPVTQSPGGALQQATSGAGELPDEARTAAMDAASIEQVVDAIAMSVSRAVDAAAADAVAEMLARDAEWAAAQSAGPHSAASLTGHAAETENTAAADETAAPEE